MTMGRVGIITDSASQAVSKVLLSQPLCTVTQFGSRNAWNGQCMPPVIWMVCIRVLWATISRLWWWTSNVSAVASLNMLTSFLPDLHCQLSHWTHAIDTACCRPDIFGHESFHVFMKKTLFLNFWQPNHNTLYVWQIPDCMKRVVITIIFCYGCLTNEYRGNIFQTFFKKFAIHYKQETSNVKKRCGGVKCL